MRPYTLPSPSPLQPNRTLKLFHLPLLFCLFSSQHSLSWAAPLLPETYTRQVFSKNDGAQSLQVAASAYQLKAHQSDTFSTVHWVGQILHSDDKTPTLSPSFQGIRTQRDYYATGLQQDTSFGTSWALTYRLTHTQISGTSPLFMPLPDYYDASPRFELTQMWWKNGFGRGIGAKQEQLRQLNEQQTWEARHQLRLIRVKAEITYWKLAASRRLVQLGESTLKRAQLIRDWAQRRVKLQLADQSDLLQAEASLKMRDLELAAARETLRSASREFNDQRGESSDTVSEDLVELGPDLEIKDPEAQRYGADFRFDRRAQQASLAQVRAQITEQKNDQAPTIATDFTYQLLGRNAQRSEAFSDSFTHPNWTLGARISVPLNFGTQWETRQALVKMEQSQELRLQRTFMDQELELSELMKKAHSLKERIALAKTLSAAQKAKADFERGRLDKGRTTTYQVILFEQDQARSLQELISLQAEYMATLSTLQLYSESSAEENPTL